MASSPAPGMAGVSWILPVLKTGSSTYEDPTALTRIRIFPKINTSLENNVTKENRTTFFARSFTAVSKLPQKVFPQIATSM